MVLRVAPGKKGRGALPAGQDTGVSHSFALFSGPGQRKLPCSAEEAEGTRWQESDTRQALSLVLRAYEVLILSM